LNARPRPSYGGAHPNKLLLIGAAPWLPLLGERVGVRGMSAWIFTYSCDNRHSIPVRMIPIEIMVSIIRMVPSIITSVPVIGARIFTIHPD